MEKAVTLQVRKELSGQQQQAVIKLKGSLISKGYTEIIHIVDQDDEFHINSFETPLERRDEAQDFIRTFISQSDLVDTVTIKQ
ncbi:hypothetical protein AR687_24200 [Flavobacteriaceae bacterium CRH]|nr:hypothetical protein AR687_24200 [Flavobacteriaceae bacterium CRH]